MKITLLWSWWVNTKINIDVAIGRVATTNLPVDDKVIDSMLGTLVILKELGFKYISKGDTDDKGQHKP